MIEKVVVYTGSKKDYEAFLSKRISVDTEVIPFMELIQHYNARLAVPRSFSRAIKAMQEVPVKAYYVQNEFYHYGATVGDFNGVELKVYDRERTICDCFKYRSKLDSEIFNKAINAYVADPKKNLANLSKYAKDMGVYTKLMNVMEVLLNG